MNYYKRYAETYNFEVVFVSLDQSEAGMMEMMQAYRVPWLAVPYSEEKIRNKLHHMSVYNAYGGSGIPNLLVLDSRGKVLTGSFKAGSYLGPKAVLDWLRRKNGE